MEIRIETADGRVIETKRAHEEGLATADQPYNIILDAWDGQPIEKEGSGIQWEYFTIEP